MYKIYCDASLQSRRTLIAVIIFKDDKQILKIRRAVNASDSLAAEAFAIKIAILIARDIILDFGGHVTIYSDCQSIVEHLQGLNRKPHTVTFTMPKIPSNRIKLNWIPRDLNNHADALAY